MFIMTCVCMCVCVCVCVFICQYTTSQGKDGEERGRKNPEPFAQAKKHGLGAIGPLHTRSAMSSQERVLGD
jgi:hypothetical protein